MGDEKEWKEEVKEGGRESKEKGRRRKGGRRERERLTEIDRKSVV